MTLLSRRSALVLSLLLAAWSSRAQAPQPNLDARRKSVEDLLELTDARGNYEKVLAMIRQRQMEQIEKMRGMLGVANLSSPVGAEVDASTKQVMDLLQQRLSWDKLKDKLVDVYVGVCTEDEIKAAVDFFRSPQGQAFSKKQPEIMQRSMQVSQQLVGDAMPQMMAIMEELRKKLMSRPTPPSPADEKFQGILDDLSKKTAPAPKVPAANP